MSGMADVVVKRCDLCEAGATHTVVLKENRRSDMQVDLCDDHYTVIEQMREVGRTPQGLRAYRRYKKVDYVDRSDTY